MPKTPFISIGSVRKVKVAGNTIDFVCQRGLARISVLVPGILRIRARSSWPAMPALIFTWWNP